MKQYKASAFFIILALILLASPYPALADQNSRALASPASPGIESASTRPERTAAARKQFRDVAMSRGAAGSDLRGLQWHYQASAQVTQLGLVEAVLPAGVFFGTDGQRLATGTRAIRAHSVKLHLFGSYHTESRNYDFVW